MGVLAAPVGDHDRAREQGTPESADAALSRML